MPDRHSFAMALDRPAVGAPPRLVRTATSLPAELLDTRLFDDLPEAVTQMYVSSIVQEMFSREFLTDVGLRMRGLKYADLVPYSDYQGSQVSWAVNSNLFARGLRRQGKYRRAEEIEGRILNGINKSRQCYEFWYVDTDGRVFYLPTSVSGHVEITATNMPEKTQAWTVSAGLRSLLTQGSAPDTASSRKAETIANIHSQSQDPYRASISRMEATKRLERDTFHL